MPNVSYPKIRTDETLMEEKAHGQADYPLRFYDERMAMFDFNRIDWHWHRELEFVYVETGQVEVSAGRESSVVHAGEACMINSKALHCFSSEEDAIIPNFVFSAEIIAAEDSLIYRKYVKPLLTADLPLIIFTRDGGWNESVLELLQELIRLQREAEKGHQPDAGIPEESVERQHTGGMEAATELDTAILFSRVWALIFKNTVLPQSGESMPRTALDRARIDLMMQYIKQNYMNTVTLEDIAGAADISKSTALNLFRQFLKTTPYEYLIGCRLSGACALLKNTQKTVSRIAAETGFESVDYFCRVFKKRCRMTPTIYRKYDIMQHKSV